MLRRRRRLAQLCITLFLAVGGAACKRATPGVDAPDASIPGADHRDAQVADATEADDAAAPDAAVDASTDVDGGRRDASVPDASAVPCSSTAECSGPSAICYEIGAQGLAVQCTGATDCTCGRACAFEYPDEGCGRTGACALSGTDIPGFGLCVAANGGGRQGDACVQQFDGSGRPTTSTCEVGRYCLGATRQVPNGTCAQICNMNTPGTCEVLGNGEFICSPLQGGPLGLCLPGVTVPTDLATACTTPADCDAELCVRVRNGGATFCSGQCSPRSSGACGEDAVCVPTDTTQTVGVCLLQCTQGGTTLCSSINPAMTCHHTQGFGFCLPACATNSDCAFQGQTCDPTTHECN